MDKVAYFNELMARMEELLFHELSDCAAWKTEFIGVDFIQSKNIEGETREAVIESCIREITKAGLVEEISYAIAGKDILLCLKIKGCIHLAKEIKLKERGIPTINCVISNMILDQLIEKLNYETTYIPEIKVEGCAGECNVKCAIYETPEKIGCVSDWSEECRLIDETNQWTTITAKYGGR